jgi:hypothetical protein
MVITNVPLYINWVQNSFPKTLAIIGSNQEMHFLAKSGKTALDLLNSKFIKPNKLELTTDLSNTNVIFNSELTRDIYLALGYKPKTQRVQYLNFAPYSLLNNSMHFNERNYSIGFITSHFSRRIKNPGLARNIFKLFPDENKLVIGNNHQDYSKISNTNYFDLVPQKVLAKFLSETKLVIITSYFDSSPSLLSEAIINGCNVLVSKNVGGNNLLGKESVIENYNDINEWKEKVTYLISNKVEYNNFQKQITNSKSEIINLLNTY